MRATVRPPIQQAEALSGWCSRREASPTICASVQRRRPKCTAIAIPANRAAAEDPQPLPMGISLSIRIAKGVICAPCRLQHFAIRVQDEMFLKISADGLVAAGGFDRELVSCTGVELDVEVHRQCGSIERWPKIGGRGGKSDPQPSPFRILVLRRHVSECSARRYFSAFSSVRITASSVASSTIGGRRNLFSSTLSPSLNKSPR